LIPLWISCPKAKSRIYFAIKGKIVIFVPFSELECKEKGEKPATFKVEINWEKRENHFHFFSGQSKWNFEKPSIFNMLQNIRKLSWNLHLYLYHKN
jgi:hypothetical protein